VNDGVSKRYVVGKLTIAIQRDIPIGTLLGPKDTTGEWLVVFDKDDENYLVGYATQDEVNSAVARAIAGECHSIAETRIRQAARSK